MQGKTGYNILFRGLACRFKDILIQGFLHPEHAEHMRDIVVQETLEDIDKVNISSLSNNQIMGVGGRGGIYR